MDVLRGWGRRGTGTQGVTWGRKGGMGKRDMGTHRDEDQRVSSDAGGRGDAGKANELLVKKK